MDWQWKNVKENAKLIAQKVEASKKSYEAYQDESRRRELKRLGAETQIALAKAKLAKAQAAAAKARGGVKKSNDYGIEWNF